MKMRRLISKQQFDKNMEDYSQLCCTEPPLNNMGVSEQHVFETFESPASAFHAAGTNYMDHLRQHDEHQVGNFPPALCSQFPTHHSNNILLCQSSQYNFSIDDSSEKAGSNFDFSDTLQSLVKSHCSSQCFSNSSEKPNKIPCYSMIRKPFPHTHNTLLGDQNDVLVKKQLSVPSDSNHPGLNVCDSSSSRPTPSNKKRIRWTEDLHDQFVKTVDLLGGAEKATPRAILKLMNSNLLTILHVKSHLQKYRTSRYMPESLQEKSERRSSANGKSQLPMEISMQMKEALQLQLEVERRLHQQLELQQNLQSMIEEELRKLKIMFDQQQNRYKRSLLTKTSTLHNSCPNQQVPRMLRF
ncbi:hypothetical protein FH972_020183 [Carpinus fangiana]|uniref:HTH myb-type domain-containing protein n=1 Tax=Carpinus fangiana TaxID=176857 RepID=A0A5N6RTZ5_9ROSI|nr:hypothetical protein FH972_020183 [Carpinus fangiana]